MSQVYVVCRKKSENAPLEYLFDAFSNKRAALDAMAQDAKEQGVKEVRLSLTEEHDTFVETDIDITYMIQLVDGKPVTLQ